MESYPHEFLAHNVPLMFVAGLDDEDDSGRMESRHENVISDEAVESAQEDRRTTGTISAERSAGEDHAFAELRRSLRSLLGKSGEKNQLWRGLGDNELFRILLVNKTTRLPPRKINTSATTGGVVASSSTPHSALSPLTPHSPVYPDGLISPMWIRKHADVVPSVLVHFLQLPDLGLRKRRSRSGSTVSSSATTGSRLRAGSLAMIPGGSPDIAQEQGLRPDDRSSGSSEAVTAAQDEAARRTAQSQADTELIREIAERKKKTTERGIKFTVVLLAGRDMLDDPGLDSRLSVIRRQSGLDSRASLFVLTPVGEDELIEFAASLQESLFDPAMEYYANHYKRNRRKRSRLPANLAAPPYGTIAVPLGTKQLSAQGWGLRYDYKASVFSEIRGEGEASRKHLDDSWHELVSLLLSSSALPARTKRWAEAKVLTDCVAVKICRSYLYQGDGVAAAAFLHRHITCFSELSKAWGIGEDTFEYWSWMARQYRIFAELMEMAIAAGLRIAVPLPTFSPASSAANIPETDILTSAFDPAEVLQHPGFYWYMAGSCNTRRRDCFLAVSAEPSPVTSAPGFANEEKADHAAIIIELYTKAYTIFETQSNTQPRLSLLVTSKIAEAYAHSAQQELALRFLGGAGQRYEREGWQDIAGALRGLQVDAAKATGAMDTVARLTWDMMGSDGFNLQDGQRDYQEEFEGILATSLPTSSDPVLIDTPTRHKLFRGNFGFWVDRDVIGNSVQWRMSIMAEPLAGFHRLVFNSVIVELSGGVSPYRFNNDSTEEQNGVRVPTSRGGAQLAKLEWSPGQIVNLRGSCELSQSGEVAFESCTLIFRQGPWQFDLKLDHSFASLSQDGRWMFPSVRFDIPRHKLVVTVLWQTSAYCDEVSTHQVRIVNADTKPFAGSMRVEIGGTAKSQALVQVEERSGEGELDVALASLEAGAELDMIIYVTHGIEGSARITLSLKDIADKADVQGEAWAYRASQEVIARPAFTHKHQLQHGGPSTVDAIHTHVSVISELRMQGERPVKIHRCDHFHTPVANMRLLYASTDADQGNVDVLRAGDAIAAVHMFEMTMPPNTNPRLSYPVETGYLEYQWSLADNTAKTFISKFTMPPVTPPEIQTSDIMARLQAPRTVVLGIPFLAVLEVSYAPSALSAASGLTLQIEATESFVWRGQRHCRLPLLLPGQNWTLEMAMIPVGLTGRQSLPKMHVLSSAADGSPNEIGITAVEGDAEVTEYGIQVIVHP